MNQVLVWLCEIWEELPVFLVNFNVVEAHLRMSWIWWRSESELALMWRNLERKSFRKLPAFRNSPPNWQHFQNQPAECGSFTQSRNLLPVRWRTLTQQSKKKTFPNPHTNAHAGHNPFMNAHVVPRSHLYRQASSTGRSWVLQCPRTGADVCCCSPGGRRRKCVISAGFQVQVLPSTPEKNTVVGPKGVGLSYLSRQVSFTGCYLHSGHFLSTGR